MTAARNPLVKEPTEFLFGDIVVSERDGEVRLHYGYDNGLTFCEVINLETATIDCKPAKGRL